MLSKESAASEKEGEYYPISKQTEFPTLVGEVLLGLKPVGELLQHPEFSGPALEICIRITGSPEEGKELFQKKSLEMLEQESRGRGISLFGLYYTSTRNLYRSGFRKPRPKLDDAPVEEHLRIAADGNSPEDECLLNEVLAAIESQPRERQLAFRCYLLGYSSRETAKLLREAGVAAVSHVTVSKWNKRILRHYFNGDLGAVKKAAG